MESKTCEFILRTGLCGKPAVGRWSDSWNCCEKHKPVAIQKKDPKRYAACFKAFDQTQQGGADGA